MSLVDKAEAARAAGDAGKAQEIYGRALVKEREALALLGKLHPGVEPSWSVLHASAASIALKAGRLRDAEKLAAAGIAGDPPVDILEELRILLDEAQYHRHLGLGGIKLGAAEFQMSLAGRAVGHGSTTVDQSVRRIQNTTRLIERTAERKAGVPFHNTKGLAAQVRSVIAVQVGEARAASYALTFSVARRHEQLSLFPEMRKLDPVAVVDEFFECVRLLQEDRLDDLKQRIGDDDYYSNFLALARSLAPDGTNITTVGLTRGGGGKPTDSVAFRRLGSMIGTGRRRAGGADPPRITGVLDEARGRSTKKDRDDDAEIAIVDDQGKRHPVRVPRAFVADLVRPNYGYRVTVLVEKRGKHRFLLDIFQATADSDPVGEA